MGEPMDAYRRDRPRIGAVAAMALDGGGVLASTEDRPDDLRASAVMDSMTTSAHQCEDRVDLGCAGTASRALFTSDQPGDRTEE